MVVVYITKSKYKIFLKRPKYGKPSQSNLKYMRTFTYTTNNPRGLMGAVAKKGNVLRYG